MNLNKNKRSRYGRTIEACAHCSWWMTKNQQFREEEHKKWAGSHYIAHSIQFFRFMVIFCFNFVFGIPHESYSLFITAHQLKIKTRRINGNVFLLWWNFFSHIFALSAIQNDTQNSIDTFGGRKTISCTIIFLLPRDRCQHNSNNHSKETDKKPSNRRNRS